jgi:adapter protein MecA 1/2
MAVVLRCAMKIERISENVIKVTISITDLEERNIDLDTMNYNSAAAQELFWDMMEQAELELDFEITNSQLVIEPYPDEGEGFIITVTRVDDEDDFESIQKFIKNRYHRTDIKVKKSKRLSPAVLIYSFEDFDHLCQLAKKLERIYKGDSSLYEYNSKYYLVLRKDGFLAIDTIMMANLLAEYGNRVHNVSFIEGYLNEYGTLLMRKNCLETLRNYF